MLTTTIKALVCAGVTFAASAASANDMNSNDINSFELTNIQFLAATGANGFRFDLRDRRDAVKDIIDDRIAMVRERREEIKFLIREDETLSRAEKAALWEEYASYKSRLSRLYADRRGINRWGVMDVEELEEFYAPTVSVS